MKIYIKNKESNAIITEVVRMEHSDGTTWLVKMPEYEDYCKVNDIPEGQYADYDCEEDRLRVGNQIASIRKEKGISLRKLESMTGILNNNISIMERGKVSQSVDSLTRLADALGYKVALVPKNL